MHFVANADAKPPAQAPKESRLGALRLGSVRPGALRTGANDALSNRAVTARRGVA